jgi:ketosteroid isomerase-like protein
MADTARAMSQENVELVYRAADAIGRRDLEGLLALMAADVRADPLLAGIEGGYTGHDGIRRWWKNLFDWIPDFTSEVVEMRDLGGDLVLAVTRNRGHGAESATPFEETTWLPARIRQGECVWWGNFMTESEALEAAGLRE